MGIVQSMQKVPSLTLAFMVNFDPSNIGGWSSILTSLNLQLGCINVDPSCEDVFLEWHSIVSESSMRCSTMPTFLGLKSNSIPDMSRKKQYKRFIMTGSLQ